MIYFISIFWFIIFTKKLFFWIYLWQLKEYHIGRFLDHFRTEKGKQLLLNKVLFFKILLVFILFFGFFFFPWFGISGYVVSFTIDFIFVLYFVESASTFKNFIQKKLKTPVFTKKTLVLILITLILAILYPYVLFKFDLGISLFPFGFSITFPLGLLVFDILTPIIVSTVVLGFQPLAVLARNQIIRKAKQKRGQFKNLLVIGITGSYGKTSTKEFLATILSERFRVLKTKEHQNSEMGISQCILDELKPEHEIFIVEMGAYNRGGIRLLCDIVKPKIGIVTGVNEQHLATFGSMENLLSAEGGRELIESLPRSESESSLLRGLSIESMVFFNAKNKYCLELFKRTKIKKFLYGEKATFAGGENILGAMAVAKELGMTDEEISRGVEKIENKFPGIQVKKGIKGLNIVDATYSANPDGVIAHLEYLKTLPGQKVIVMPCLIELGSVSKEVHKKIGKKIGEVCDLAIITTKDRFKEIKEGVGEKALFMENPKEIFEKVRNFCREGDIILLEGRVPKEVIELLSN